MELSHLIWKLDLSRMCRLLTRRQSAGGFVPMFLVLILQLGLGSAAPGCPGSSAGFHTAHGVCAGNSGRAGSVMSQSALNTSVCVLTILGQLLLMEVFSIL